MRYGSNTFRFEIPAQYEEAVAARRLKTVVLPVRHPNLPTSWPSAKDVIVYVNNMVYREPWKRTWPTRAQLSRSFLPLDITAYLRRSGSPRSHSETQSLLVDVLNKDYFSIGVIAIVETLGVEEVMEKAFQQALSAPYIETTQVESLLRGNSSRDQRENTIQEAIARNDSVVASFYTKVMEVDLEEGLEADDPIVTTKCPISQATLQIPVRGRQCHHLQCFDMTAFLLGGSRSYYWNCPLCDGPVDLQVDTILWKRLVTGPESTYLRLHPVPSEDGSTGYEWQTSSGAHRPVSGGDLQVEDPTNESQSSVATPQRDALDALPTGAKRSREETEGSADCPIEL